MRARAVVSLAAVVILAACTTGGTEEPVTEPTFAPLTTSVPTPTSAAPAVQPAREERRYDAPPPMLIDPSASYSATITTNFGTIEVALFANEAPLTVNNFVFLARDGYYDGVIIHRVAPGFVIQGGDPEGTGRGGPGYEFQDELETERGYTRGIVAMANAGPDTNGSQFFIMLADVDLPNAYSIFGEVTSGLEVVDAIAQVQTRGERPLSDVVIERVEISES